MNNQEELLILLKEVKNVLDKHNIKFWLECGTLLGAVRDGKFIPWEKDIDFGVWQDQFSENIKNSVSEAFIERGFQVWVTEDCMTIKNSDESFADINSYHLDRNNAIVSRYDPNNIIGVLSYMFHKTLLVPYYYKINPFKSRVEFIRSIFVMISRILPCNLRKKLAARLLTIYDKVGAKNIPWIVPKYYISELSTMNFLGMEFNIPAKTEEYLAFRYNKDWRVPRQDWITTRDDNAVNKKCSLNAHEYSQISTRND